LIGVGVVGASPVAAIGLGAFFGFLRGLAVLLGAPLRSTAVLLAFHRRVDAWAEPVRLAVIGVQLLGAIVAAWVAVGIGFAIVVTVISTAVAVVSLRNARPATDASAMSFGGLTSR
jgi:hypothetical protein